MPKKTDQDFFIAFRPKASSAQAPWKVYGYVSSLKAAETVRARFAAQYPELAFIILAPGETDEGEVKATVQVRKRAPRRPSRRRGLH